jgi:hypothetical protein
MNAQWIVESGGASQSELTFTAGNQSELTFTAGNIEITNNEHRSMQFADTIESLTDLDLA